MWLCLWVMAQSPARAADDAVEEKHAALLKEMVEQQIEGRGVRSETVLRAMEAVPRHRFVPPEMKHLAYSDGPLPIGQDQTISQPYIVALMTELLELHATDRVLEVGTGSGYQAAVLAEIASEVYSVEIIPELHTRAKELLTGLGYKNIFLKLGDGTWGWSEHAPYDKIIVTAATSQHIPEPLETQLREGGILVIPVGTFDQQLVVATKQGGRLVKRPVLPVRFVSLVHTERQ
jgi:protein-L-isoaspartate(D-aspartate) O-methyltransferase